MFEEGILVIIIGGCVVLGIIIGVAITWQTLRGAIMANIKEFASLRALGVGMGSLNRIVMELSFWVGVVGVAASLACAPDTALAVRAAASTAVLSMDMAGLRSGWDGGLGAAGCVVRQRYFSTTNGLWGI